MLRIALQIVFEIGKMVKGEGLQELNDRMKTLDSSKKDIYKFLGVKQVDSIKMKKVYYRAKEEI